VLVAAFPSPTYAGASATNGSVAVAVLVPRWLEPGQIASSPFACTFDGAGAAAAAAGASAGLLAALGTFAGDEDLQALQFTCWGVPAGEASNVTFTATDGGAWRGPCMALVPGSFPLPG
jgi:hypothetical protein